MASAPRRVSVTGSRRGSRTIRAPSGSRAKASRTRRPRAAAWRISSMRRRRAGGRRSRRPTTSNAILNRAALERFGITRDVDRVAFGHVEKGADGAPTGVIHDLAVMGLERAGQAALAAVVPAYSDDRRYQRLLHSLDLAIGFGITTVVEPQNSVDDLPLFERARREVGCCAVPSAANAG